MRVYGGREISVVEGATDGVLWVGGGRLNCYFIVHKSTPHKESPLVISRCLPFGPFGGYLCSFLMFL